MNFFVFAQSYGCYGGHATLSLIPIVLLRNAGHFGPAVSDLTLTFHFATRSPPRRTLEDLYHSFHAARAKLPKVVFRRSREQATIDIASDLIDGDDWNYGPPSRTLMAGGIDETLSALPLLRQRLTPRDNFRLDELLAHCARAAAEVPATDAEFGAFIAMCQREQAARQAALSPWDRLDVEWRDFHPDARKILDDPFYWEEANDFSPHGNDTGSDLIADYRRWRKRHPAGDAMEFYERLLRGWGFARSLDSEIERTAADEAAVALAFAELKLRGVCPPEVAQLALAAIERQRHAAEKATNWPHRADRLRSLELLLSKLPQK